MKRIIALMALMALMALTGCSDLTAQFVQFDQENAAASREFAKDIKKNWSLNSGFWHCLLQMPKVSFPIGTPDALVAILGNNELHAIILQLDMVVQASKDENGNPYWSEEDYASGCVEGLVVRGIGAEAVTIASLLGGDIASVATKVGGKVSVSNPKALLRLRKK